MNELRTLLRQVELLKMKLPQWDESVPVFFFLEEAMRKARARVAVECLEEQSIYCREALPKIGAIQRD